MFELAKLDRRRQFVTISPFPFTTVSEKRMKRSIRRAKVITVLTGDGIYNPGNFTTSRTGEMNGNWPYRVSRKQMPGIDGFLDNLEGFWRDFGTIVRNPSVGSPTAFHYWVRGLENSHDVRVFTEDAKFRGAIFSRAAESRKFSLKP